MVDQTVEESHALPKKMGVQNEAIPAAHTAVENLMRGGLINREHTTRIVGDSICRFRL